MNSQTSIETKYAHVIMLLQFLATREIREDGIVCPRKAIAVAEDSIKMAYNALEHLGEDTRQDIEAFEYANAPVIERKCPGCQFLTKSKLMADDAGNYISCNHCHTMIELDESGK